MVSVMHGKYVELSAGQRIEAWPPLKSGRVVAYDWRLWQAAYVDSLPVGASWGVIPATRRRSVLALKVVERKDISRELASSSSIRDIAKALERAASTVSRRNTNWTR